MRFIVNWIGFAGLQIFEGKFWKCPQIAYLQLLDRKFQFSDEWNEYLDYQPLEPYCTTAELKEFLNRNVEPICKMCPAENHYFELPSPLKQRGNNYA